MSIEKRMKDATLEQATSSTTTFIVGLEESSYEKDGITIIPQKRYDVQQLGEFMLGLN